MKRRSLSLLTALALCLSLLPVGVLATEEQEIIMGETIEEIYELPKLETSALAMSLFSARGSTPAIKDSNEVQWIDRIANLPDYASVFYDWLEENSDNDGENDALIDVTQADTNSDGTYIYQIKKFSGSVPFTYDTNAADKAAAAEEAAAEKAAYAAISEVLPSSDETQLILAYIVAAFSAFDRDHPEVFWLDGEEMCGNQLGYGYQYGGGSGTATYEFDINFLLTYTPKNFDIRAEGYQDAGIIRSAISTLNSNVSAAVSAAGAGDRKDKLTALNDYLTKKNAYNSSNDLNAIDHNCREAVSALEGRTGATGPVCEGYARAFKVVCDELGIPCVLIDGLGKNSLSPTGEAHMWNAVEMENGKWYAVDVTWNDPVPSGSGTNITDAISGHENHNYLLVGSDTEIDDMPFSASHEMQNTVTANGLAFTNGPELEKDAFAYALPFTIPPTANDLTYTGNAQQLITAGEAVGGTMLYSMTETGTYSGTLPTATNAGDYTVWYKVDSDDGESDIDPASLTVTIKKAENALTNVPEAISGLAYNGTKQALITAGEAKFGQLQYKLGEDGEWSTTLPTATDAGTYTVYYKVDGNDNYADLWGSVSASIAKATPNVTAPTGLTATYGQTLNDVTLSAGWDWESPNTSVGNAGSNTFPAVFTPTNTTNYNTVTVDVTVTVDKADPTVTAPSAIANLIYDGSAQTLVTAGSATGGTMLYSMTEDGTYSGTLPTAINAGSYTVWYKVAGDANHNDTAPQSISITISPMAITPTLEGLRAEYPYTGQVIKPVVIVTVGGTRLTSSDYTVSYSKAPVNVGETCSITVILRGNYSGSATHEYTITKVAAQVQTPPAPKTGLAYNENPQELITAGSATGGTMQYSLNGQNWSTVIPTATNAGTHIVYYKVFGNDNHSDSEIASVSVTIAKADNTVTTAPTAKTALVYNGEPQALVTEGAARFGAVEYKLGESGQWSTDVPIAVNAGTYTVYYRANGSENFNASAEQSITVTVSKAPLTITSAMLADKPYDGKADGAVVSGITFNGFQSSDTLVLDTDYTVSVGHYDSANAGERTAAVTVTLKNSAVAKNYVLTTPTITATGTISKLPGAVGYDELYITNALDKTYRKDLSFFDRIAPFTWGNPVYSVELTAIPPAVFDVPDAYEGITAEMDGNVLVINVPHITSDYEGPVAVADVTITSDNYEESLLCVTLIVNNKTTLTLSAGSADKTYDAAPAALPTVTAADNGSAVTPVGYDYHWKDENGVPLANAPVNAGSYTLEIQVKDSDPLYTGSVSVPVVISPAPVTVKADDKRVYVNGELPELSFTVSGLKGGDTLTTNPALSLESEPDLTKTGSVAILISGAEASSNYALTHVNGTLTISNRPSSRPPVEKEEEEQPEITAPVKEFTDVHGKDHWAKEAVDFVVGKGLFTGKSDTIFDPDGDTTRAQIVTVLWRLAGSPVVNYLMTFEDVSEDAYYAEAVRWAASTGIVNGYDAATFAPNRAITREQLAAILWRYAKHTGMDVSVGENTNILSYTDAFSISDYAYAPLQWACGAGVMGGYPDGSLKPGSAASRAHVAQMLKNFLSE